MGTKTKARYGSAARRWAGVGPYYAMFPASFAQRVIRGYTKKGDVVLDPFSGRGTAIFAAADSGRSGIGIEINPVGYVYTKAKLTPAPRHLFDARIREIGLNQWRYRTQASAMPLFFQCCYCESVRAFLLTARNWLDWRNSIVDCTVMALLLVHLHGKRTDSLSNQMRQAKSMSPQYAIDWWAVRKMKPPIINPAEFMVKKLTWRYAKGQPDFHHGRVLLGDSVEKLGILPRTLTSLGVASVDLLLTSPPYCGITNYHYDQWLRLWLLGGPDHPIPMQGPNQGKFVDQHKYRDLLRNVFTQSAALLSRNAVVYVRTDSRRITLEATIEALRIAFPKKEFSQRTKPFLNPTQTKLFGGKSAKGEVDIILK
jgi:DNA methylase